MSVTCAPSPCGPALPVARLAGRYSCDYYGHSVAIGLASRRRSHVQQRYTSERDLGVPFASFNALTGHRSCAPEDYGMLLQFRRRDRRRLQASFRRGTSYPFWRLGFRQSSFRHITRIFPARRPVRLGTAAGFLACYCPLHLSDLGSAIRSRDISSHLCPLRGRYNTAPRGAAAAKCSNCTDQQRPTSAAISFWPASTTGIDRHATSSHRGGPGYDATSSDREQRALVRFSQGCVSGGRSRLTARSDDPRLGAAPATQV
jgi:hypothetical protein